jgi:CHAT domain-containing protein
VGEDQRAKEPANRGAKVTFRRVARVQPRMIFRDGVADLGLLRDFPSLPDTATELQGLSKSLGAGPGSLILREHATETEIRARKDMDQFRVITFATHGITAGEIDGASEPALVLTPPDTSSKDDDGLLTASEISALNLDANWVILSACNTAASDGTPGAESLSGLARAFFFAGARTLLVSHWSVESAAASLYTQTMMLAITKLPNISEAEAARLAKVRIMTDPDKEHYGHPIYWAPFSVVGDGWRR